MAAKKTNGKLAKLKEGLSSSAGENPGGWERRRWMKNSLGALGALGLGALALRGDEMPKWEGAPCLPAHPTRPWREERVFIFFNGKWYVDPGHKVVSRGQVVTWRAFQFTQSAGKPAGNFKVTLNLLPEVFEVTDVTLTRPGGVIQARVREDAPSGFYPYNITVDGQAVEGGSSPGVIVDP